VNVLAAVGGLDDRRDGLAKVRTVELPAGVAHGLRNALTEIWTEIRDSQRRNVSYEAAGALAW